MRRVTLQILSLAIVLGLPCLAAAASGPAYEQDLVDRVEAALAPPSGDSRGNGREGLPLKCGTPLISEVKAAWPSLSEKSRQMIAAVLQIERPVLSEYYDTPDGLFRIHFDRTGPDSVDMDHGVGEGNVPTYVLKCAELLEIVVAREVDELGFPLPVSDAIPDPGEDARYDIYFQDLGFQFYGLSVPDQVVVPLNSPTAWVTSWMILHSDFELIPPYRFRPFDAMAVTLAHEFHHASHWTIDGFEAEVRGETTYPWFLEMSATAMEELVFDQVNDYYAYLNSWFTHPWLSLRHFSYNLADPGINHPYAACIWILFLSERYGDGILREIWDECGQEAGFNTLEAFETVLNNHGSSFADEWAEFLVWNYFTGSRAAGWGYEEGLRYDTLRSNQMPRYDLYPVADSTTTIGFPHGVDELGAQYLRFVPGVSESIDSFKLLVTAYTADEWMVVTAGISGTLKPDIRHVRDVTQPITVPDWNLYDELLVILTPFPSVHARDGYATNLGYKFEVRDSFVVAGDANAIWKVFSNPLTVSSAGTGEAFRIQVKRATAVPVTLHIYTLDGRLIRGGKSDDDPNNGNSSHWDAGLQPAELSWNGKNRDDNTVASGIYLALVRIGDQTEIVKVAVKNGSK